jgi:hypothetical protein
MNWELNRKLERIAVYAVLKMLSDDEWKPYRVDDGCEDIGINRVTDIHEAYRAVMAVDESYVNLKKVTAGVPPKTTIGWVRFVMGNDPDEVVCDYTTSIETLDHVDVKDLIDEQLDRILDEYLYEYLHNVA